MTEVLELESFYYTNLYKRAKSVNEPSYNNQAEPSFEELKFRSFEISLAQVEPK